MHTSATTASSVPGQRAPERDEKSTSINETVSIRNRPATAPQTVPSNGQRRRAISRRLNRILASCIAAISLAATSIAVASPAQALVLLGNDGTSGRTSVQCYADLDRAHFEVDLRGNYGDWLGVAIESEQWNGYRWVALPGVAQFTGSTTLYKGWWGPVSQSGYYRHTVTYKRYDARYGVMNTSREVLGHGSAHDSYQQMHRTSTGGYIGGSASYCTV